MGRFLTALIVLVPVTAAAQSPASQDAGRQMAERWCMSCHLIERDNAAHVGDKIPSFTEIARDPAMTRDRLVARLSTGHTRMPNFRLSDAEKAALIAYIQSQK